MFNLKFKKNKKSISEILSFLLINLLVFIFALGTFIYSSEIIESKIKTSELQAKIYLIEKIENNIQRNSAFHNSIFSFNVKINYGKLIFKNNQIKYFSKAKTNLENEICNNKNICFYSEGGFEVVYKNITNFNFSEPLILEKKLTSNIISFKILKGSSEIEITKK